MSDIDLSKALNRLGENAIIRDDDSDDVGTAFQKFAVVTKELSNLMKNLVSVSNAAGKRLFKEISGELGDEYLIVAFSQNLGHDAREFVGRLLSYFPAFLGYHSPLLNLKQL